MSRPRFRAPMLATLVGGVVEGDEWVFERKLDGIRLLAVRDGEVVRLFTRNRSDHSSRYPELVEALLAQPQDRFVVDGEVVAFAGSSTSFARLQQRSGTACPSPSMQRRVPVELYLFDLIHLNGTDRDQLGLLERKALLHDCFEFRDPLRFCAHRNANGTEYLQQACDKGWEGLIAKRVAGRYRSGRSRDWLKLKCVARQEFVIGGFSDPRGSRIGIGALLLGYHRGEDLRYAGRVGTGFDDATLQRLRARLDELRSENSPFADAPSDADVHWVKPDLVCEVGFTEWTDGGRLRHPRYLGLRDDKAPGDVIRETPEPAP